MGFPARQTMDGRPRRTGFPACQKTAIKQGARKNFVPLCPGGLFFSHHEGTKDTLPDSVCTQKLLELFGQKRQNLQ
jgi:hypothetical protein